MPLRDHAGRENWKLWMSHQTGTNPNLSKKAGVRLCGMNLVGSNLKSQLGLVDKIINYSVCGLDRAAHRILRIVLGGATRLRTFQNVYQGSSTDCSILQFILFGNIEWSNLASYDNYFQIFVVKQNNIYMVGNSETYSEISYHTLQLQLFLW